MLKLQISRENRMDTHKNAPLTPKGREAMVRIVIEGGVSEVCRRTPVQHYGEDGRQMGRTLPRGRCGWFARSLLKTSFIAKPNPACHVRGGRGVAPAAPHRQADRRRGRCVGGDRQPHPASGWASTGSAALEPAEPIRRYQREHPGELIDIDIKKLGKFNRIGHRITGDRTRQSNLRSRGRGRAGSTSMSASTTLLASPSARS